MCKTLKKFWGAHRILKVGVLNYFITWLVLNLLSSFLFEVIGDILPFVLNMMIWMLRCWEHNLDCINMGKLETGLNREGDIGKQK